LGGHFIGEAKLQNAWRSGVDVDDNSVPNYVTFDLTAVYRFTARGTPLEATFGVDNLFDRDPVDVPVIPGTVQYGTAPGTGGRFDLYDPLDRRYRVGLRARF
jgi:outer membrane receptor protein involved in Fe transport